LAASKGGKDFGRAGAARFQANFIPANLYSRSIPKEFAASQFFPPMQRISIFCKRMRKA
jgi:hypothetical protein